jgi:hypothetical protein
MNENEYIEKNITLSFEFSKYLFEHPEIEEKIPLNAKIVLLPEYDPKLCEFNKRTAELHKEPEQPLVFVKVKDLAPKVYSRLIDPVIEIAA